MVKARATFVIADPKTYTPVVVHAGEDIPDWALDKVTNPDILGDGREVETIESFDDGRTTETVVETVEDVEDDIEEDTGDLEDDAEDDFDPSEDFTIEDDTELPTESWLKADIANFLAERGVSVSGGETKDELLAMVREED